MILRPEFPRGPHRAAPRRRPLRGGTRAALFLLLGWLGTLAAPAQFVLSEFMASNDETLADEDGDSSDWIEVHNPSSNRVSLAGWHLTDSAATLTKWTFPATNLDAGGYLIVFASGKDRRVPGAPLHTNFRLAGSGEYLALVAPDGVTIATDFGSAFPPQVQDVAYGLAADVQSTALIPFPAPARVFVPTNSALGLDWTPPGFDDGEWVGGVTGVGFDLEGLLAPWLSLDVRAAAYQRNASVFVRLPFDLVTPPAFDRLDLIARYDDGLVVWLNGAEVARRHPPAPTFAPRAIAHWSFDETTGMTAADSTGTTNFNGVLKTARLNSTNVTQAAEGVFGGSGVGFANRANGYLETPFLDGLRTNSYTFAAWIKPSDLATNAIIADWAPPHAFLFFASSNLQARHRWSSVNASETFQISGGAVVTGVWQHVALTWERASKTARLYLNGAEVASATAAAGAPLELVENNRKYHLGWKQDSSETFNGLMDEAWVIAGALEPHQLRLLMESNRLDTAAPSLPWGAAAGVARGAEAAMPATIDLSPHRHRLQAGRNVLAVQLLNVSRDDPDLLLAPELIGSTIRVRPDEEVFLSTPSPGWANPPAATNAPPEIGDVEHQPKQPGSAHAIRITAEVEDADGVASVRLRYQIVRPGEFIPAFLAHPIDRLLATPNEPNPPNPAFEAETNWTEVPMLDDGRGADAQPGDGRFAALIPAQSHRTLVRYRVFADDAKGAAGRLPLPEDPSLNFACYVSDGLPAFRNPAASGGATHDPTTLATLPAYSMVTDARDWLNAHGYDPQQQIPLANKDARSAFNWEGALVYDGEVYDHVRYRLRQTNDRYSGSTGKRSLRIRFQPGRHFQARDPWGRPYPVRWRTLNTSKMFSNTGTENFGVVEMLNHWLWNSEGTPAPDTHWFHFRVVAGADEASGGAGGQGDFWGLGLALEDYDSPFLEAHDLPDGNLYKLKSLEYDGNEVKRHQGAFAVHDAADFDNIRFNCNAAATAEWLRTFVNYDQWYGYHVLAEAIGHYDMGVSLHSPKNRAWYFEPQPANPLGRLWTLPYDSEASWGQTFGTGTDDAKAAIFDPPGKPEFQQEYRNRIRHIRDLLWRPEALGPLIDHLADFIEPFAPADRDRWRPATASLPDPLQLKMNDMKRFAFVVGTGSGALAVPAGGRAAYLDNLAAPNDTGQLPETPALTSLAPGGFPVDQISFAVSPFRDPQGIGTMAALEWRIAEVTDPRAPAHDPAARPRLEITPLWTSGPLTNPPAILRPPAGLIEAGHAYRARARYLDTSGRWSRWSEPVAFIAGSSGRFVSLRDSLRVTELMYHPAPPAEGSPFAADEFEFVELSNLGADAISLVGVRLTGGIDFDFGADSAESLAPGERLVLVRNRAAFVARYGEGPRVGGEFTGRLDDGGERVTLRGPGREVIQQFTYSDAWHPTTDGLGFALVPAVNPPDASAGNDRADWRPGGALHGSPGAADTWPGLPGVVVNEVLARGTAPGSDAIELFNPTGQVADIGGWYLTDDPARPKRFRLGPSVVIAPGGFLVVTETEFRADGTNGFGLDGSGEAVFLFSADAAGELTGYSHGFRYPASAPNVSFGRHVLSTGEEVFLPQAAVTLGATNTSPRAAAVVFTEIHYHPASTRDAFVELRNVSGEAVACFDTGHPTNTWKLDGADFEFPEGVMLAPGGFVLVTADRPEAFRARHGLPAQARVLGPFRGSLDNAGERLGLLAPEPPGANGAVRYRPIESVRFDNRAPWPGAADGGGASLQRRDPAAPGEDPATWVAALPSPAADWTPGAPPAWSSEPADATISTYGRARFESAAGGAGVRYQWRFNGEPLIGATNATLDLPRALPRQAGVYDVVAANESGAVASRPATLRLLPAPVLLLPPDSVATNVGARVQFSILAYGEGALSYQWRFNGEPLPGAHAATLVLTNVQVAQHGAYSVEVRDAVGVSDSAAAALTVLAPPGIVTPLQPQTVVEGEPVTFTVVASGHPLPLTFRWQRDSTILTNMVLATNTASLFLPAARMSDAGRYAVRVSAPGQSALTNSAAQLVVLADFDRDRLPDAWEVARGFPTNDAANAALDSDGDGASNLDEYLAGTEATNALDVLRLVMTGRGEIAFHARSNRSYAAQFLQTGGGGRWTTWTNLPAETSAETRVMLDPLPRLGGRLYRAATPAQPIEPGPLLLLHPVSQRVPRGATAEFRGVAVGLEPLSYQWRRNGLDLPGQQTDTLRLDDVPLDAAAGYSLVVRDALGATESEVATLFVLEPPVILAQPRSINTQPGGTALFTVEAEGRAPLRYRWIHRPSLGAFKALRDQTNATLVLADVESSQAGAYAAIVSHFTTNGWVSARSTNAFLLVSP